MGKLSKEELARFQGAAWALRMVEEKGLEAAQKDLDQRGIRHLPLACNKNDIRKFEEYEKKNTLATVLMMTCMTLWFLSYAYHEWKDHWVAFDNPTVHAWMPLPKHYQPQELFAQDEDLMEHAMFEDDPDWLYKDNAVYTQMTLEEFMEGKTWTTTEQRKAFEN